MKSWIFLIAILTPTVLSAPEDPLRPGPTSRVRRSPWRLAGDLRRRRAAGLGAAGVRPAGRGTEGEDRGHPDGQRGRGRPGPELAEFLEPWTKRGVASATLLHTRSRAKADEPAFTRPLEEATGVWFSGGDQSRVTDAYLGTAVERRLRRCSTAAGSSAAPRPAPRSCPG